MSKPVYKDLQALSDTELTKELAKVENDLYEVIAIRSNQSNEIKMYHNLKKKRAQINTEQTQRRLGKKNKQPEPTTT